MPRPDAWGAAYMAWLPDPDILDKHRAELAKELEATADSLRAEHPGLDGHLRGSRWPIR